MNELFDVTLGEGPLVAVAIHHGHELRAEVLGLTGLSDETRLREEDPHTGAFTSIAPTRIVVNRSRFEMDLNRPRERAVYGGPEDAWGLDIWAEIPPPEVVDRSIEQYDAFYNALKDILVAIERAHKRFIVLDIHSYNHRRDGAEGPPADPEGNPEINIGTGSLDRKLWGSVADTFIQRLGSCEVQGRKLDVRENVRFNGGELSRWVHRTFPQSGCALAVEFKKTFVDEWTGELDDAWADELKTALSTAVEPALAALNTVKGRRTKAPRPSIERQISIGFVVNDVATEGDAYTTVRLAMTAKQMGHDAYLIGVGDLAYDRDEQVRGNAQTVAKHVYKSPTSFLRDLRGKNGVRERVTVGELDILMLRNDPAADAVTRPWAAQAGLLFGREAMRNGVVVLNDPDGLAKANSKMYFQSFPAEVRPETIITRSRDDIRAFVKDRGKAVLKPLTGSGGQSVFLVRESDLPNLNQMIDSVSRDGFVIAQEYLPAAEAGDTRLFVMNGEALRYRGKYAAFRRLRGGADMRSNIHAGGSHARAEIDPQMLELVEIVRPKLMADGMFLVGLDIVGDKLMEINVFSPGGLGAAQKFEGVNFSEAVIKALERKTRAMTYYQRQFDNVGMAIT